MNGRIRAYTVVKLAYGSYDVLLDGIAIASLTRDVDVSEDGGGLIYWSIPLRLSTRCLSMGRVTRSVRIRLPWTGSASTGK